MNTTYVRELSISYKGKKRKFTETLREAKAVAPVLRSILPDNRREHFLALYLNGAHEVVAYSVVSTGTANSTQVHPREVFQPAIVSGAIALIVGHNHPSGNCEPSFEDRKMTKLLKEAGEIIGIKLLDHLVVSDLEHYSFAENCDL
jgi:DNA repair protein RadC